MYTVFSVEGGYQIFWCPSEHERKPLNNPHVYPQRQSAYRRAKKLNDAIKDVDAMVKRDGAIIL